MKKIPKIKIPEKMRWLFWSYDINSMDLDADKDYIIQQVLNYGTWDDVKWLLKTYPKAEIEKIIRNPSRGGWFDDVLNFWETIFDIRIDKDVRQRAILNIYPHT